MKDKFGETLGFGSGLAVDAKFLDQIGRRL
jgi:hypothetical protein